eukprot:3920565-Amphidinium_carterae.1
MLVANLSNYKGSSKNDVATEPTNDKETKSENNYTNAHKRNDGMLCSSSPIVRHAHARTGTATQFNTQEHTNTRTHVRVCVDTQRCTLAAYLNKLGTCLSL